MKPYHILKDFTGNQTGNGETEHFKVGTTATLSTDLARIAVGEGWAEPVGLEDVVTPVVGLDKPVPAGDLAHDLESPAELRETKVVGPDETKVVEPEATKSLDEMDFNEMKALAKTKGIKLFGMSQAKLLAALKAAA